MACINCQKIRTAILHGRMAEAAGITVDALREKLGLKESEPAVAIVGEQAPEIVMPEKAPAKAK